MIISITDNGIGMSEEFQKRIFETFERERNTTSSHIEGNGIGMGITKKLVELMDGTIEVKSKQEKSCKVEVDTHIAAVLRFASGALVNLAMSFDVWKHSLPCIELHGTAGSLSVPDPNCFGGEVRLFLPHLAEWAKLKLTHGYTDNMRGIGAADLARSLSGGVPARACGELAFHVLDVMCGISDSARTGAFVKVQSTCERPAPLPVGLRHGQLELEA